MYTVKVGEFYVAKVEVAFGGFISSIVLSKETEKVFTKDGAVRIAQLVNGKVFHMEDITTNE